MVNGDVDIVEWMLRLQLPHFLQPLDLESLDTARSGWSIEVRTGCSCTGYRTASAAPSSGSNTARLFLCCCRPALLAVMHHRVALGLACYAVCWCVHSGRRAAVLVLFCLRYLLYYCTHPHRLPSIITLTCVQVRINGENPAKDFQPCPGVLGEVVFPTHMDGVRVDSWVEAGTEISPFYDSLLAKLMVHAPTRELAVKKLKQALAGRNAVLQCACSVHTTLLCGLQLQCQLQLEVMSLRRQCTSAASIVCVGKACSAQAWTPACVPEEACS